MRFTRILTMVALVLPTTLVAKVTNLQCVPFARDESGVQIFGDAHTWWGQAEGRYQRGKLPVRGAVMAFRPHGSSRLGHVAVVAKIVNSREVLLNHANWSPINGRRGQIERGVRAVDVSDNNDWSKVRVWYAPIHDLGTSQFPLYGFIYPEGVTPPKAKGKEKNEHRAKEKPRDASRTMAAIDLGSRKSKGKEDAPGKADRKQPSKPASILPASAMPKPKGAVIARAELPPHGAKLEKPREQPKGKADAKSGKEAPPRPGKGTGLPGIAKLLGR